MRSSGTARGKVPMPAVEEVGQRRLLDVLNPASPCHASWNGAIRGSRNGSSACASDS